MATRTGSTTRITRSSKGTSAKAYVLVSLVGIVALYFAYSWWFSDERVIRHQLTTIAGALTVPPGEGSLGMVTRAATLRKVLAPEIRISGGSQELVSRETVLGMATRVIAPAGGLTVEFDDVQVKVGDDRVSADVYCTAKLTTRDPRTGEPSIDAREVSIGFVRRDGEWIVVSAQTESTLAR